MNLNFDNRRNSIDKGIRIFYYLEVERDEAIIGVDNKVENWNHAKWTNSGELRAGELKDNWTLGGIMEVKVVQENTYPPNSGESKKQKAFFGLISQEDFHKAYLCDEGATGLPDGLENIIDEQDFQDFCLGWYYECAALTEEDD